MSGPLFRAFIDYMQKTLIVCVFFNVLFLLRRKFSKLFQRRRSEKSLRTIVLMDSLYPAKTILLCP